MADQRGEFVDHGRGHNPDRGITSYVTESGETLKFTQDGKTMSLYDKDPADPTHSGTHITNNGDGTFTIASHGDRTEGGDKEPPRTGRW